MGNLNDWERVNFELLGKGGRSEVVLVRTKARRNARDAARASLQDLSTRVFDPAKADQFARSAFDLSRPDKASELAALKTFIPRKELGAAADELALARLQNEIQILEENEPGFVKLLDSNKVDRWMVTEYCAKGTLENNLSRYVGNVRASLEALVPLIKAVGSLHSRGIVHRDIKPQNIFVGENDELLLGDFGLVFLPDQPERLSRTGESVGPRDFMPPWVFLGPQPPKISPQFDVYMLGKVLWCMVTGKLKLHREDFLEPELNVLELFKSDPHMHMVNLILQKTVVPREKECLGSASDLFLVAGKLLQVIQRGGQLLQPPVPRPCHICGNGYYALQLAQPAQESAATSFQFYRPIGQAGVAAGGFQATAYACDSCGHVQFFKTQPLGFIP